MKLMKKSLSVILAILMLISIFSIAALTTNAAESSNQLSGAQVNASVKSNWDKLKNFLSTQEGKVYSYYNKIEATVDMITKAEMILSGNRVAFSYHYESEAYDISVKIREVDINTTSTVEGGIHYSFSNTNRSYEFCGNYSVGLENCYSSYGYTISDTYGYTYREDGFNYSPALDYYPSNQEFTDEFSSAAKRIESLLLKPAVNLTLEDLGFGVYAADEPETTAPETQETAETTVAENTEPQTNTTETAATENTEPLTNADGTSATQPSSAVQTKTFSYLPSKQQAMAGYNYKLSVQDDKGGVKIYNFTTSDKYVDGVRVYTAEVPADTVITVLSFQVYDGDKWVSQVSVAPSQADGEIIKSDGTAYKENQQPTKTVKKANTIKVKTKTVKAKAKKKTVIKKSKAFTIKNAVGKVTFKKVSGDKKIKISKAGKITVKKGLKKGKTFKLKVKITAAGNSKYSKKTLSKTVKIKIA